MRESAEDLAEPDRHDVAVDRREAAAGPDNQYTLEAEGHLADTLALRGDTNAAIARSLDLHRRWRQQLPYDLARRKIRELANLLVRHHQYEAARAAFTDLKGALVKVPPERPDELEALIQATAAVEGWDAAADVCRTHLDEFPDSLTAWQRKAWIFCYVRDEQNLRATVRRVLNLPAALARTNEEHIPIEIAGIGDRPGDHAGVRAVPRRWRSRPTARGPTRGAGRVG